MDQQYYDDKSLLNNYVLYQGHNVPLSLGYMLTNTMQFDAIPSFHNNFVT